MGHTAPMMRCAILVPAFLDGFGSSELFLILAIILVLFGGKRMPELARGLGRAVREFRRATSEVEHEFKQAMDEVEKTAPPHTAPALPAGPGAARPKPPPVPVVPPPDVEEQGRG